jgi:predicted regulator of Ras-like GTPase activity (Roadblock/LC7/MglB family)
MFCFKIKFFGGSAAAISAILLAIAATPTQAQFNTVTTVDDSGGNDVGMYSSIAIGSDDLPIISYFDDRANALKVAHCNDRACATPATLSTVDDTPSIEGRYSAIAIGNDGLPVISYQGGTGDTLKVAKCTDVACALPATITAVADPLRIGATYTSIAIGNGGRPVISYTDDGLKVARCANAECTGVATITNVDSSSALMGYYTSITIGLDGLPIVSYFDLTNQQLITAKCGNSTCSGANIITEIDDAGAAQTAIAIRSDGVPFIAFQDDFFASLKVVQCGNTSCNAGSNYITLPNTLAEDLGSHADIAIGIGNRAYISHYNATTKSLMVSVCLTSTCTEGSISMTLDSAAPGADALGQYSSIAIGVDDLAVISYYDAEAGALKVVHCATRACDGLFRGDFE